VVSLTGRSATKSLSKYEKRVLRKLFHYQGTRVPVGFERDLRLLEQWLEAWKDVNAKIDKRHSEKGDSLV
jgi:hypothetical protein